jgi:hypothetical protein
MSLYADRFRRKLARLHLELLEKDPVALQELERAAEAGEPEAVLTARLDLALARETDVASTVAAGREAVRELEPGLEDEDRRRLRALERRVLAYEVGVAPLKAEIFRLARRAQARELLDNSWFQEVFERVGTRRAADLDGEPYAAASDGS